MPEDSARISELQARLAEDPNSRLFLQLAEEYRKAGRYDDAVKVCRSGLEKHPKYTSAHVTLARSLMAAGKTDEARAEFEQVIASAPDNIMANRCLGDIYYDEGMREAALERYKIVGMLNPEDAAVADRVAELEGGTESGQTARELFGPRPSAPAEPAAAEPVQPPEELDDFMDLKIDESVILNADMVKQALAGGPPKEPEGEAPKQPPVQREPPVQASEPPVQASEPPPSEPPEPAEPIPSMEHEVGSGDMDDFADMGMDDFSEFSSPTVMLSADELKRMAEAEAPPESESAAEPQRPAEPEPRPAVQERAARSAEKYGFSTPPPTQEPAAEEPADRQQEVAQEPPEMPDLGEPGLDEFGEFAAPTVMMNIKDLQGAGVLDEEPAATAEAPPAEPTATSEVPPSAPAAQAPPAAAAEEPAEAAPAQPTGAPWESPQVSERSADITSRTLAELYFQQGHLEKARELYQRLAAAHPDDAEVEGRLRELSKRLESFQADKAAQDDLARMVSEGSQPDATSRPAPSEPQAPPAAAEPEPIAAEAPLGGDESVPLGGEQDPFGAAMPEPEAGAEAPAGAEPEPLLGGSETEAPFAEAPAEPVPRSEGPLGEPDTAERVEPEPVAKAPAVEPESAAPEQPAGAAPEGQTSSAAEPEKPEDADQAAKPAEGDRKAKIKRLNAWLSSLKK